jgi:Family of unknown function (DUF5906)
MKSYIEHKSAYPPGYTVKPEHAWLAERCVITNEGDWHIRLSTGVWQCMGSQKAAKLTMCQHWLGGPHSVTEDDVQKFMNTKPPVVQGTMRVPTSKAPVVEFADSLYVNTWRNTIQGPAAAEVLDSVDIKPALTLFMRMLREGLCGQEDERDLSEMLVIANSRDTDEIEFRFMMNWLAAIIQAPGVNLQTNMWLVGKLNGMGRGTLTQIMVGIMGGENAVRISGADLEKGGWNDGLENKLLGVLNEVNGLLRGPNTFDWDQFLKQTTTEDVVPIRKRNHHAHPALNFCNYIGTTNVIPAWVDKENRRDALIGSSRNPAKLKLALNMQLWLRDNEALVPRLLAAFVTVLMRQKVDHALLLRAPETLLKADIVEGHSRDLDELYWLDNDDSYPRNQWHKAHVYVTYYTRFMRRTADIDPRKFGMRLTELFRCDQIERRQIYKTGSAEYLIPSANTRVRKMPSHTTAHQDTD